MYECSEFVNLVRKADSHRKNVTMDRFERMAALIGCRQRLVQKLGDQVLAQCKAFERKHVKNEDETTRLLEKIEQGLKCGGDVQRTIQAYDQAIRLLPYRWTEWPDMYRLMALFVDRGRFFYQHNYFLEAYCDMRHVSAILTEFQDKTAMILHLNEHQEPLRMAVAIKLHLVPEIDSHNAPKWLLERLTPAEIRPDMAGLSMPDLDGLCQILKRLNVPGLLDILNRFDDGFPPAEQKCIPVYQEMPVNYTLNRKVRLSKEWPDQGRQYLAKDYIVNGETLVRERPILVVLFSEYAYEYCTYCHRNLTTAWPCQGCDELVYCSAQCARYGWDAFHRHECGLYGLMLDNDYYYSLVHVFRCYSMFGNEAPRCEHELTGPDGSPANFVEAWEDYVQNDKLRAKQMHEWTPEDRRTVCRAVTSLLNHRGHRDANREANHTALSVVLAYMLVYREIYDRTIVQDEPRFALLVEHLSTALSRVCTNGFCWAEERRHYRHHENGNDSAATVVKVASCICFMSSFFNHSCEPNVSWEITDIGIRLQALKTIRPGEPLTICYGPKRWTPFNDRQQRLKGDYSFFCRCPVCRIDVAQLPDVMRCLASGMEMNQCPGPLVLNQYEACLRCGQKPNNLSVAYGISSQMVKANENFLKTARSIAQKMKSGGDSSGSGKLFRIIIKNLRQWLGFQKPPPAAAQQQQPVNYKSENKLLLPLPVLDSEWGEDDENQKPPTPISSTLVSEKKLSQLEKFFRHYHAWAYSGSYNLLNQCSMLVYVYSRIGRTSDVIGLLKTLHQALDDVIPELVDTELLFIIKKLDYLGKFFHHLIRSIAAAANGTTTTTTTPTFDTMDGPKVCQSIRMLIKKYLDDEKKKENPSHGDDKSTGDVHDPVLVLQHQFWSLVSRLNSLLYEILHYDMNEQGCFFPAIHESISTIDTDETVIGGAISAVPDGDVVVVAPETTKPTGEEEDQQTATESETSSATSIFERLEPGNFREVDRVKRLKLSALERNFKRMYEDCRRRMSDLDILMDKF